MIGLGRLILPDAVVGHDAQELVAARPRYRTSLVTFGESNHDKMRGLAQERFSSVRVNQNVRVDRDQRVLPGSP